MNINLITRLNSSLQTHFITNTHQSINQSIAVTDYTLGMYVRTQCALSIKYNLNH